MPPASGDQDLRTRWFIGSALAASAAVLMVLAIVTSFRVLTSFHEIRLSASDNIEWSLAQIELETRDFTAALEAAISAPVPDIAKLRMRFDILYSRIDTLSVSPHYTRLHVAPKFQESATRLRQFIDMAVPLIDSPDVRSRVSLLTLREMSSGMRADTRQVSVSGLNYFAERSDRQRAAIASTMLQLAVLFVLLVAALVALVVFVFNIYHKARRRGVALAQANQRMHTILTTSQDGVIVTDHLGRVLEFNAAAEQIFQLEFATVQGRQILDFVAPDHTLASHAAAVERMRNNRGRHIAGQGRVQLDAKRADGTIFPMEIAIEPANDGPEQLFVAFVRDISKRMEAEQELVKARDHALASEQAKANFFNVMSHEIRTPLNGVLGNLSMLNDTQLSMRQTRFVRNMEISGRMLMRQVDSSLDIARLEAGHLNFDICCTDLSALITDLVNSQIELAQGQGTTLDWHWVGPPQTWVRTDRAALEQVLLNLLGNAIKFTHQGRILIEVETLPQTQNEVPVIELRVVDTGIGIPADTLETIFDDFVTRDVSIGQVTSGTGLGLGIARRIVQALDGKIGVQSTQGQGSVFWVQLPMSPGNPPPALLPSDAIGGTSQELGVLVVEDNDINRELTSDMLVREGHKVTAVADGAAGVDAAAATRFDLILMDIAMPVMDGLEATRLIRCSQGASRAVPIIAVSANILPTERDRIIRAGITAFLAKPMTQQDLHDVLSRLSHPAAHPAPPLVPSSDLPQDLLIDAVRLAENFQALDKVACDRLMARFIGDVEALVSDLADLSATDLTALGAICHAVAGSAAVFGASALRSQLVQIETAAKADDHAAVHTLLKPLPELWQGTKLALQAVQIHPQDT